MRVEDRSEKGAESAASGNFSRLSFFKVVATGCLPANKAHDANLFSPIGDRLLSKLSASATSRLWTTALESRDTCPSVRFIFLATGAWRLLRLSKRSNSLALCKSHR
jgi:hypothetical protein